MARANLGDLLHAVEETRVEIPAPQAPETDTTAVRAVPDTPPTPRAARAPRTPRKQATPPEDAAGPRYLQLQRKEARLTDEQLDQLTLLTRRLNKRRKGEGERITDNTLIRVAVDLLLARESDLGGATERDLRKSVGL